MAHIRHRCFSAALAILALALVAAGCGSAPQVDTQADTLPTAMAPDTPTSAPEVSATALPVTSPTDSPTAARPTESPTLSPNTTDTTEAEVGVLSAAASRVDLSQIITVLPKDAIPAILDPEFVTVEQANRQMRDDEDVIGLTINGESRAYPINMLSSHEIVNDQVGGVAIAVTW